MDDFLGHLTARLVGHDTGVAGRRNHGNVYALLHRFDARPAACALLAGSIDDVVYDLSACFVVFCKDIGGDADEEAFELA